MTIQSNWPGMKGVTVAAVWLWWSRQSSASRLNPVTVNETTVLLRNQTTGQWLDAELALDASRTVAIFTPVELLTPNTQFRLQITTGVTDTAGNPLATNYSYYDVYFTT